MPILAQSFGLRHWEQVVYQASGSLKGRGHRLINPTFVTFTSDRECRAQGEREQTEKQETSSILTESRQNHRSISPYRINFVRTVPGDQGFETISSCPFGLEGIVQLVLIVQTEHHRPWFCNSHEGDGWID